MMDEKKEAGKRKWLWIGIGILIILLPTVVALIAYLSAKNHPVTEKSVASVVVSAPDGLVYTYPDGNAGRNIVTSFIRLHEGALSSDGPAGDASDYQVYTVRYTSYGKLHEYRYYMTESAERAYYTDDEGNCFRILDDKASEFLVTPYAVSLYPMGNQPVLRIGRGDAVLPVSCDWHFLGADDNYFSSGVSVDSTIKQCEVSGGLELSFDRSPDYCGVAIHAIDGTTVFEGPLVDLSPDLFDTNTVYDVTLNAKWYQYDGCAGYGEADYHFIANVMSPAVFYLNESEVSYGQFLVISAKNVVDPSAITFSSEPSIHFNPVFFSYGGYCHALVPLSLACRDENNNADSYVFSLGYGDAVQQLNVRIKERSSGKANIKASASQLNTYRGEISMKEFSVAVADVLSARDDSVYWLSDNVVMQPISKSNGKDRIKYGFGIRMILENKMADSYDNDGVDFSCKENETVFACLPGKVAYVGETTYMGKTVIVEHGGGLKSLYGHLNSISVNVGDTVTKGAPIGLAGSSGLCFTKPTVHFGLYVFDVPVRYYDYETYGIRLADTVEKAMGVSWAAVI